MKNGRFSIGVMAGIVVLSAGLIWGWARWKKSVPPPENAHSSSDSLPLYEPHDKPMTIVLKTVDSVDGKFFNTTGVIRQSQSRYNQMKQAVLAYLGPRHGSHQEAPVPEGMELNEFYFTPQGMAVVDLSMAGVDRQKFGFYEETLLIRGLIEVLTGNFYEVKQVRLLVDGLDAETLGGHYALGTSENSAAVSVSPSVPVN